MAAAAVLSGIGRLGLICALLAPGFGATAATLSTLSTLHAFNRVDGVAPASGLLVDTAGGLYGSTGTGGPGHQGVVFKLTPSASGPWTFAILHAFASADGAQPSGALTFDISGSVYGVTRLGGAFGQGAVFMLTPPAGGGAGAWTETVLYSFMGGADGAQPVGGLVFDTFGSLYGTTSVGGGASGQVFMLTPPATAGNVWTKTALFNFVNASGGAKPNSSLFFDTAGSLYGTTTTGPGPRGAGVVFKLSPASGGGWTESVLYAFKGASDGAGPTGGLILDTTGALYGETALGGASNAGEVFRLTRPSAGTGAWTETPLYSFSGGADGGGPAGGLMFDTTGSLFGVASLGGDSGNGAVFQLSPPTTSGGAWTEGTVYSFAASDGAQPRAGLAVDGSGAVYGALSAGPNSGSGTVFRLAP